MKDLQLYGEYFSKRGYAFIAPNFNNYTTSSSSWINQISDFKNSVSKSYLIQNKMNLIGYSKGAQPILYFSIKNPQMVSSVALLAPALNVYSNSDILKMKNISFKIWHGNADVNVPNSVSTDLVKQYNSLKLKNITLNTLNGKGHFDIDTEYISEIYNFFQK
jgi:predicted esterase